MSTTRMLFLNGPDAECLVSLHSHGDVSVRWGAVFAVADRERVRIEPGDRPGLVAVLWLDRCAIELHADASVQRVCDMLGLPLPVDGVHLAGAA